MPTKPPSYESLVKQGRQAAKSQWTLGDLASRVEIAYGDGKLQEYAEDIGVDYRTLLDYRTVARAYEKSERSDLPWSVHRVLAAQEDRVKLVTDPKLTYRAAQALIRGRKELVATPGIPPLEEETWLSRAYTLLRPLIAERTGIEVPAQARVSIGFPLQKGQGTDTVGQAWQGTKDKIPQIYISPELEEPERVLDVLAHEMLHAGLPATVHHSKPFAQAATKLGLEGPAKATFAGPILKMVLKDTAEELGTYPHAAISPPSRGKVKTKERDGEPNTVKFACVDCQSMNGAGEGYYCKITVPRGLLQEHGWPQMTCPIDGKQMEIIDE
jgi:hypothetical protein